MAKRHRATVRFLLILMGLAAVAVAIVLVTDRRQGRAGVVTAARRPSNGPPATTTTRGAGRSESRPTGRSPSAPKPNRGGTDGQDGVSPAGHDLPRAIIDRMLGQMIVARFGGLQPSPAFLQRIRLGQIGGVILFADNITADPGTTRALTGELQAAAARGGNPPLLIMTDQEGGTVRRLPGPPTLAASDMSNAETAFQQGQAAGSLLRSVGINLDLAPVADVEAAAGSFLGSRAFGISPALVADRACAFARGLASRGVGYTLKHFPGLGRATASTDTASVTITAPPTTLRSDYLPYQRCASNPLALVMVSSAIYPALTGPVPAVMSPLTYQRELRIAAQRAGVPTISDDLQASALADQAAPAREAINAGLDLAMYAQTEQASAEAYRRLREDLTNGRISHDRVRAAAQAILQLKRTVTGR